MYYHHHHHHRCYMVLNLALRSQYPTYRIPFFCLFTFPADNLTTLLSLGTL